MAKEVYAQPEEPGESAPSYRRFIPGLGLTNIQICPHYQKVRDYMVDGLRLFEDITYPDSMGRCFYALPDGSFIYQDEYQLLLCGEGYGIHNGQIHRLTNAGETLELKR